MTTPNSVSAGSPNSESGMQCLVNEMNRLRTFASWPVPFISKEALAAAGFYYLNVNDEVKCFFCGVVLSSWEEGDDPMQDHKRWSPHCPVVRANGDLSLLRNMHRSNDACGIYSTEILPNSSSERDPNSKPLEFIRLQKPAHPKFACDNLRLRTFQEWPKCLRPRPKELCEAGFYYSGEGDKTYCFYCGGGLRNWRAECNPWEEHAKWYPRCSYVIAMKGKQFVDNIPAGDRLVPCQVFQNLKISTSDTEVQSSGESSSSLNSESTRSFIPTTNADRLCKICFEEDLGVVTLPCSHLATCVKCAPSLSRCPICREKFKALVRVKF